MGIAPLILNLITGSVAGKITPVPAEEEAVGSRIVCGRFGKEQNLLALPAVGTCSHKLQPLT